MSATGEQDQEAAKSDDPAVRQPRPVPVEPPPRRVPSRLPFPGQGLVRAEIVRLGARRLKRRWLLGFDLSAVDDALKREGLLRDRFRESLPPNEDVAIHFSLDLETYLPPSVPKILNTPKKRRNFWILSQIEPERLETLHTRRREPSLPSCLAEFGPRPHDLKHAHLTHLFERGHFEDDDRFQKHVDDQLGPRKLVAYLMLKGFTRREELKELVPELDFNWFHRTQAEIHAEVERTFPKISRDFLAYLENLTDAQREAVERYHLKNEDLLSKAEIARSLGISVDALKDRLEGAMRRLLRHFRPWIPSRNSRPKYWKGLFRQPDTREDGMFVTSRNRVYPVYRIDPVTERRLGELEPCSSKTRTPHRDNSARKEWIRLTTYRPQHDGTNSALLAHMPNVSSHRRTREKHQGPHVEPAWIPGMRAELDQLPPEPKKKGQDFDYTRWRDRQLLGRRKGEEEPWSFDGGWDFESQWDE